MSRTTTTATLLILTAFMLFSALAHARADATTSDVEARMASTPGSVHGGANPR